MSLSPEERTKVLESALDQFTSRMPTPTVAQLKASDQDLIKRALLVYYEQTLQAYQMSDIDPDAETETEPTEIDLTLIEIASMYGALTGKEIPKP